MLRQKCSYRNNIENRKKPESKEKKELKFAIRQKQVEAKLLAKNRDIYDDFSKKCHAIFKKILFLF